MPRNARARASENLGAKVVLFFETTKYLTSFLTFYFFYAKLPPPRKNIHISLINSILQTTQEKYRRNQCTCEAPPIKRGQTFFVVLRRHPTLEAVWQNAGHYAGFALAQSDTVVPSDAACANNILSHSEVHERVIHTFPRKYGRIMQPICKKNGIKNKLSAVFLANVHFL